MKTTKATNFLKKVVQAFFVESEKAFDSLDFARQSRCNSSDWASENSKQQWSIIHIALDTHIVLSVYNKAFGTGIHTTGLTSCCNF